MAANPRASVRSVCDLLTLAQSPTALTPVDRPVEEFVLAGKASSSPLRSATQKRTSSAWLQQASAALVDDGFDRPAAAAMLEQVVNRPSAAGQLRGPGGVTEIGQATLVSVADSTVYVELDVTVTPGPPPAVDKVQARGTRLEASPTDLYIVTERLEVMRSRLGLRDHVQHVDAPREVLLLGAPTSGYLETPPDWEAKLRNCAAVVGLQLSAVQTPNALKAQALADRVDLVVAIPGHVDWRSTIEQLAVRGKPCERIGTAGATFHSLHDEFRRFLVTVMWAAASPVATGPVELAPKQRVYHRKISGGRKYDVFDEGSESPCVHGAGGFVTWRGDKAPKGMERRYVNFRLLHCERFPNCGMYAAEGT